MADTGLTTEQARAGLATVGPNEIRRDAGPSAVAILAAQFKSAMVLLLAIAAVIAGIVGEVSDAAAILAILALNGLVGFFQEYRAEQALRALRAMTAPRARVLRDGQAVVVPAAEVVPGDLLLFEPGDVVAADGRLVEANALTTVEASLTGESEPVSKRTEATAEDAPLAERYDRVFMGTTVGGGSGTAVVSATGMATELGKIAHLLSSAAEEATPLQRRLAQVTTNLVRICLAVVGLVALLGIARGTPWVEILLSSVSLAVAAVPEGLPAIVTVALAIGVQRMAARRVLVRRLHAVETLGSTTVICTDKTGTLTAGRMTVRELWPSDDVSDGDLLGAAIAACDATLGDAEHPPTGDPTEIALLEAGRPLGIERSAIERDNPRTAVEPFDTSTRRMAITRADGRTWIKGAVEALVPLVDSPGRAVEANRQLAGRGLRVLAVAVREPDGRTRFLGLVGMADPPRPEAIRAVADARAAGIHTVMITGDHPDTARAIAREIGIVPDGANVDDHVRARVTAADKLDIVRSWKAKGHVVAMTGDGVNDAPAIREAHIGIAMGRTGTEVTREASDIVLVDDDYESIIEAVRQGRAIWDNIRKTLVYLMAGNAAELTAMLGASLVGLPLPLLPAHLLWVNLVTDGLPALALVGDPPDPDVLTRKPRRVDAPAIGREDWARILGIAAVEAAVVLGVFAGVLAWRGDVGLARTLAFTSLVWSELFRSFAARSPERVLFEVGVFTNPRLVGVVLVSAALQIGLLSVPWLRSAFDLAEVTVIEAAAAAASGLIAVSVVEIGKLARRGVAALRARNDKEAR